MSHPTYKHVIVVGIDGAGAFIKDADTPHFDRIFADGAVTYQALASNPTISAECWGSMLLGVGPEVHKLTNGIVSSTPYPTDSPFPSLFRRIRDVMPDAELGSYCDWNPITYGIVESDRNVSSATARDSELTPVICDYIRAKKPAFLFIQMDSVDGAGHGHGYGSEAHLRRIHEVDEYVDAIHKAAEDAGMLDETLFMVIADHGGTPFNGTGAGHGGWTDAEKLVTFANYGWYVEMYLGMLVMIPFLNAGWHGLSAAAKRTALLGFLLLSGAHTIIPDRSLFDYWTALYPMPLPPTCRRTTASGSRSWRARQII